MAVETALHAKKGSRCKISYCIALRRGLPKFLAGCSVTYVVQWKPQQLKVISILSPSQMIIVDICTLDSASPRMTPWLYSKFGGRVWIKRLVKGLRSCAQMVGASILQVLSTFIWPKMVLNVKPQTLIHCRRTVFLNGPIALSIILLTPCLLMQRKCFRQRHSPWLYGPRLSVMWFGSKTAPSPNPLTLKSPPTKPIMVENHH